jgi:hypothetical protein
LISLSRLFGEPKTHSNVLSFRSNKIKLHSIVILLPIIEDEDIKGIKIVELKK